MIWKESSRRQYLESAETLQWLSTATPPDLLARSNASIQTPDGQVDYIDEAIAPLVEVLNWIPGVRTVMSCSGHGAPNDYARVTFVATDGDMERLGRSGFIAALCDGVGRSASLQHRHLLAPRAWSFEDFELSFDYWEQHFTDDQLDQIETYAAFIRKRDALVASCQRFARRAT